MSISSALPVGEPSVVPGGNYKATVRGEVSEQTSKFDTNKVYYTLPLTLQNREGETFDFVWAFGPKSPAYIKFLGLLGGVTAPSGKVSPPMVYEGKSFEVKIGEAMNREKTRTINSVLDCWSDNSAAFKKMQDANKAADDEIKDSIPF